MNRLLAILSFLFVVSCSHMQMEYKDQTRVYDERRKMWVVESTQTNRDASKINIAEEVGKKEKEEKKENEISIEDIETSQQPMDTSSIKE